MDVKITSVLERIIAFFAPHWCIVCSTEDNILCDGCANDAFLQPESSCVMCARPTADWRLCKDCSKKSRIGLVWVAAEYSGVPAKLIKLFKFQRVKAAAVPLAAALDAVLPYVSGSTLVVALPTAPQHVRQRGYDQSVLLARELARLRQLHVITPLLRNHSLRQVGASREQRIRQAKSAYVLASAISVKGRSILLIDDTCTTGASLSAAATLLKKAGAVEVNAAVVAWKK